MSSELLSLPKRSVEEDPRSANWRWQQQNRLRSVEDFENIVELSSDEREAIVRAAELFAVAATPYYASLMSRSDVNCPIRKQVIPTLAELEYRSYDLEDPLAEEEYMVAPNLSHRYPDRALFYATHNCPVYCRHCNRKRKVGDPSSMPAKSEHEKAIAYLRDHTEIRDVLLSGGDPLSFSDERLIYLLKELRSIPHLEIIRLATRNPVTLPMRITPELCSAIKEFHPIYVSTHFNHPKECTPEAGLALNRLADAGCVISNQMVLLAGINDEVACVLELNRWLLKHRCRPYYIFQCDPAMGISHFKTPIQKGLDIIDGLRGWTSGLAVPHYVVDLPGGGGKVPLLPEYLLKVEGKRWHFRNYKGDKYHYDDV